MDITDIFPVLEVTWPAARTQKVGPFVVPEADRGGNRVSAARLADPKASRASADEIEAAAAQMRAQGRAPLFQVLDTQPALDETLDAQGYTARDHTVALVVRAAELAAAPPPVTAFDIWPPLAIQTEIWEASGIDAARRAVMDRASCRKTALFGRIIDKPAGAAFIGLHNNIAMLHALEVAPVARRRGLAAHMMRLAAKWSAENGAEWLSVLVTQQNTAALGLYASLGMEPVGTYAYRVKEGGTAP